MIHPDTALALISNEVGFGVCAAAFIPAGTIIWVQDPWGVVLTEADVRKMDPLYKPAVDLYSYRNHRGEYIVCWDAGRFINHSCDATTAALGNIASIACRDIQPGEQLTEDYASFNLEYEMDCYCGAETCRRKIAPGDILRINTMLDQRSTHAMCFFESVRQPLLHLLTPEQQTMLKEAARGTRPPLSSLDNRYK